MLRPFRSSSAVLAAGLFAAAGLAAGCQPSDTPAPAETLDGLFTPVDDGADVPGFVAFRDSLRAVVARRDTTALLAAVADGARLSYGDDPGGPEGMRAMWFSGSPPGGRALWPQLDGLLATGSTSEDGAVSVPYVYGAWPDSVDAFSNVAVVGPDGEAVEARATPSDTAAVVTRLRSVILPSAAPPGGGFRGVRLPDGRVAYVPARRAMSPVTLRATFFPDADGTWKLQTLLEGD